ncbi:MAG: UDP-N-acetylglucosamine--N-acetylmuramyl-(pentapeptide) pyrophosphoryl-undecaprenol N-acetylglucosamine transferase [Candidatus Paceibacterota bacterium]|jgi:UDP-N-acetylglucosamine--N-acetylmuramyl-(pentapeptide) pyrophosphoryl-undecaprenol N-acetylglucosamine transferase
MKIVLAGGGSGGHFYPLIAISQAIRDIVREKNLLQVKIYYLASSPYNEGILFDNEIEFHKIHAGKVRRYFSIQNVIDAVISAYGFIEAFFKVFAIFPDIVISKGGFMSLPVVVAAHILRIPIVIHENDSVPGRANLFAGKYAAKIALSFPEAAEYFVGKDGNRDKIAWTGNPLRREILTPLKEGAYEYLKLEPNIPVITVFGGSLGAKRINDTVLNSLSMLLPNYQIIHQTGKQNYAEVDSTARVILEKNEFKERYHCFDYLNALSLRMVAGVSSLIISRGGSTIFEIAAWGVPSILIPISDSNGDHQRKNSYNYQRGGGAIVIDENNMTPEILATEIKDILEDKERIAKMRAGALAFAKTDAAYKIAEQVIEIALKHEE